jgi:hypothetical protein
MSSSESDSETIRLGIPLWFDRRNTFRERAVVDGKLAIAKKLATFRPERRGPEVTR